MESADDEVGDPEDDAIDVEGMRRRERHDEHRGHRGEDGDPHGALFRVERVREPRVRGPGPPQRAEQEQPSEQTAPGQVVGDEPGDLGDGKHEDEVEEQLEVRDPLLRPDLTFPHAGSLDRRD